jgi:DNA-binding IclR family transcriptional regulator
MVVRTPDAANATPKAVKSADRAVGLLEALADTPTSLTLSDLQRILEVPKSSLHGLLQTLRSRGWIESNERGTEYRIGIRALRAGAAYLEHDPVVRLAAPLLATLCRDLDETFHLARLDGPNVLYLASRESQHHLRVVSRIGRRLPAHATALGKALLAAQPWPEVDALLPSELSALTPHTITNRIALKAELAEIRVRGWASEREQSTEGLTCFSVALPGPRRYPTDAMSCSVPLARADTDHVEKIVQALVSAAADLGLR